MICNELRIMLPISVQIVIAFPIIEEKQQTKEIKKTHVPHNTHLVNSPSHSMSALVSILFNENVVCGWKRDLINIVLYLNLFREVLHCFHCSEICTFACSFFKCKGIMRTPIYCLLLTDWLLYYLENFVFFKKISGEKLPVRSLLILFHDSSFGEYFLHCL